MSDPSAQISQIIEVLDIIQKAAPQDLEGARAARLDAVEVIAKRRRISAKSVTDKLWRKLGIDIASFDRAVVGWLTQGDMELKKTMLSHTVNKRAAYDREAILAFFENGKKPILRERQVWAFQANPTRYDIERAVRERLTDTWAVGASDVRAGDLALIWKAKGRQNERGIVAFALVISDPREQDDRDNPYWKGQLSKASAKRRVKVRYIVPRECPVWVTEYEWLSDLSVAKAQNTVFRVTPGQYSRILRLISAPDDLDWLRYELPEEGADWSAAELELAVRTYFEMRSLEARGIPYKKADFNKQLRKTLPGRSKGSIEYRFQNISSILQEEGIRFVAGYKPAKNTGNQLAAFVAQALRDEEFGSKDGVLSPYELRNGDDLEVEVPRVNDGLVQRTAGISARSTDFELLERQRREIGQRGERLVADIERRRLKKAGRGDLAHRVEVVSETKGDGLGYDIQSFEEDGTPRYIEVKATTGAADSPFYLSRNELEVSAKYRDNYWLYRVFELGRKPRYFVLRPPLDSHCTLEPVSYRGRLKPPASN